MTVKSPSKISAVINKVTSLAHYCWTGVWKENRDTTGIRILKVVNLSVRSYLDRNLQTRSMSLTYSTVLAIVPAFALLFAIGRGFGFQTLLEDQLFKSFPAQQDVITFALQFVDSYLAEASQGLFVGVGIIFLLWTLISLLSCIENAFNEVWDIKHDRSIYQKITDYIAICLIVPILMICSSGVSIFMATALQSSSSLAFLTPFLNITLEASPLILAWLAFTLSYMLIPNTKVKFKYAAIAGAICALLFQILQLLFVTGQIYVSKYNAIYGSFAFLPLLLIWLQLSWLILLAGCVLTYSMQNIFTLNFGGDPANMSANYLRKVTIILAAAIVRRFREGATPLTVAQLSLLYDLPTMVVAKICDNMHKAGLTNRVMLPNDQTGIAPAGETGTLSVGEILSRLDHVGGDNFIPRFEIIYKNMLDKINSWLHSAYQTLDTRLVADIDLPIDDDKEKALDDGKIG